MPVRAATGYDVIIAGAPEELTGKLEILSVLKKELRDYPTLASLRRAARRDVEAFDEALTAAGYYRGKTSFSIRAGDGGDKPVVAFTIDPGPLFVITAYEIVYEDSGENRPVELNNAAFTPNRSAAGADLRNAQLQFLNHLWENGYPAAEIVARRAIADLDKGEAKAVFVFNSGPNARFGDIVIEGLDKTNPNYVRKLKTWAPGEMYERSKIVAYRDRLALTGLFTTIDVAPGAPDASGAAPVIVTLAERKRRTIGAGASFSTTEGPGGRLFFEHRNIFGYGESFRAEARGSQVEQSLDLAIDKPLPRLPGSIYSNFTFTNETTDAFDARSLRLSGGVAKRWLEDRLETRAALALETSKIVENDVEMRNYFVSAPLSVLWNNENDILNPTEGVRSSFVITPYTGSESFAQTEWTTRSRIVMGENDRFTLAGRAAIGATVGNSLFDLPRNKRFFAGGGGSVRGYGYQKAGPLGADGAPIGGRSLIESAVEFRVKVAKEIQLATFIDAASVSDANLPNFEDSFFYGYGAGVRYLSAIGPIRLDVAFPYDKRDTDSSFQLYIALGQPF